MRAETNNCGQKKIWNVSEEKDCYSDNEVCERNEVNGQQHSEDTSAMHVPNLAYFNDVR